MKKILILASATGLGLGYSPFAPGTVGSIPGFAFVFSMTAVSWYWQIAIITLLFFLGVHISNLALPYFQTKDPGSITIDEIVSLPITFFLIPLTPVTLIIGFILNRILDITKPPPAYQLQNLPKGWGIMVDDIISAIYSNILMHILIRFI